MKGLRFEGLAFKGQGPYDLIIEPGQCVCITGASGVGKTLLLRSIVDLDLHDGKVFLDDIESAQIPAPQWRKKVGLLPAESRWWAETVAEHFLGNCDDLLLRFGFEPEVKYWSINRLSTGEKQRLALIRLLSGQPKVLLLDEPTASLDMDNVEKVEEIIGQIQQDEKLPVLWVSHDLQQVKRVADRHLILAAKQLSEAT